MSMAAPQMPELGHLAELSELVRTASRADESLDVRGILWMEHVNMVVGARSLATQFYCDFLGFTPDPHVQSDHSFHVNLGRQQLHLAVGDCPHRIHGSVGVAVPSLQCVREREPAAAAALAGTQFRVEQAAPMCGEGEGALRVTCPWGNTFHVYNAEAPPAAAAEGSPPKLAIMQQGLDTGMGVSGLPGLRYVAFDVPVGSAAAIGTFYEEMFGCAVSRRAAASGACALVAVGPSCHLIFNEREGSNPPGEQGGDDPVQAAMRGVHLAVYVADFRASYERMKRRGLVWTNPRFVELDSCDTLEQALACRQYRFRHVVDLGSNAPLLELEHETRALRHFQFFKPVPYAPR